MNIQTLGDIYQDGESLNSREGYEESFGFQTIRRPRFTSTNAMLFGILL